jgi:SHS2 domain-containing protein
LLHAFLEELIYLKDTEGLLLSVKNMEIFESESGFELDAILTGERIDPERHEQRADIKAVTFHQFSVERESDYWRCHVILDV